MMNYLDKTILEIHDALLNNKVSPLELITEAIKRAKEDDNNAFEYISEKEALELVKELESKDKNNPLWGIPFVIKDNFATKGIPTTASSNLLNGYIPVFSSEVYLRLINAGAIPIGKTTMDELAMGGLGIAGHKGPTFNPYDKTHTHIVGGSSCGSASACASNIVPLAIGSDTGDSVRKPASYSGIVGIKPTWGRISRYGLFPFAASLDHVAYFTRSVEDSALVLSVLAGHDDKDMTSSFKAAPNYKNELKPGIKGTRVAIIKEIFDCMRDDYIKEKFLEMIHEIENKGAIVNYVSLDLKLCRAIYPTYIIISSSEATSNTANLDGIKFGTKCDGKDYEEIVVNTRTNNISEYIKRRLIIGSYSLLSENQEEVFLRAQKCRHLIVDAVNDILKDNDAIILPASPTIAPLIEKKNNGVVDDSLIAENYLALANFAGIPSITIPLGLKDNLPFGVNITSSAFKEQKVFDIALAIEEITGLRNMSATEKE